ncbi:hypothetical protein NQ315_007393 [Exocentrus adspersus]|uniref:Protein hunchback n=1 Tax=Exocentrus adspersus TaxID=1586481 RepID=A0AAV8VIH8_9CUCU|nr:hypothetical protein NQ315_007393 [Exocentrus adspersus]
MIKLETVEYPKHELDVNTVEVEEDESCRILSKMKDNRNPVKHYDDSVEVKYDDLIFANIKEEKPAYIAEDYASIDANIKTESNAVNTEEDEVKPDIVKLEELDSINDNGKALLPEKHDYQFEDNLNMTQHHFQLGKVEIDDRSNLSYSTCKSQRETGRIRNAQAHTEFFQCNLCGFRSIYKMCLKRHITAFHSHPSEIEWFACALCDFKAKQKAHLTTHVLLHKNPSEIKWYRCDTCDFKSKRKCNLNRHRTSHKDPLQVRWFECDVCNYKSNERYKLRLHMVTHKDPSETGWFKCRDCNYRTIYRAHLQTHMLVHKDPSEIEWIKCEMCDFKTKRRVHLRTHMSVHKDPSEVEWFRCDTCDFKSNRKSNLKRHTMIHKDPYK